MKKEKTKVWFKAKCYGWGWYPSTWQGVLVILIWVVLFTLLMMKLDHEGLKNIFFIFIITAVLIWICWVKGERPRWRWGK